ncbi:MAG: prepilin-type N-terminal cleavage/methylation domain-containing protein [Arcobacteraceae bacterium]|nr:prepilin-type N-terminal cleavage/methylation domain-containing protein [Arcobacteraceae bacterium]
MGKNSFTLIETLLSLIIISIIISGFSSFINQDNNFSTYQNLQKSQNEFIQTNTINSQYSEFTLKKQ